MNLYIGADLGTSALKLLLVTPDGEIKRAVTKSYPVSFPKAGWSEQDPAAWWNAFVSGIKELCSGIPPRDIKGIGAGGQMHGLVALDESDGIIRPAILWNDGRTAKETEYLNTVIGKEKLTELTGNIAFAGFTAPKILWLAANEPENFSRIKKIMLPKDYINFRLTGKHTTDFSDASGTLLLDVKNKRWSEKMLKICGISEDVMPRLCESFDAVGTLLPAAAAELGLCEDTVVCGGAGDNAAAAIGTGAVADGGCNISLGTSGTVFIPSRKFADAKTAAIHSFCHANGEYHLMGCILSAASCNKWFCEDILQSTDFAKEQDGITDEMLGRNHVYFLPYLMGERSPINDTAARGTFTGLRLDTSRRDMLLSVPEGVAFAIKDNVSEAESLGIKTEKSTLCGGGARSPLWRKIIANVLGIEVVIPKTEEGPGYGGAMLAMAACGEYASVKECAERLVSYRESVLPDGKISAHYAEKYKHFKELYPALKEFFKKTV